MKIAVLGAGAWGTAVASHLASRHDTVLWAREPSLLQQMAAQRENSAYLPGVALDARLRYEADLACVLDHVDGESALCVLAVPVAGLRGICQALRATARVPAQLLWLCKGFEADTGKLPHQMVAEVLGEEAGVHAGVLSGPSFAREVAAGLPVALTVASPSLRCRELTVQAFHHGAMRIYTSDDVIGVEVGGAVKNVLAIATGIADGLELGLNARAALITRGLAEMTRLGVALGGRAETLSGLTGLGDLVLTAIGDLSRNRMVGLQLAEGRSLDAILDELGHVAEGVRCARAVLQTARCCEIEMPITEAVCAVLFDGCTVRNAVDALLGRSTRAEANSLLI